MRVVVTGASGLIGSALVKSLKNGGHTVAVLSRSGSHPLADEAHRWDPEKEAAPVAALEGSDAVVHLAGEPVAQRWNSARKEAIKRSRTEGTRNLVSALAACQQPPAVLVSASAVGFYGPLGDSPVAEDQPAGKDFLADVCKRWEEEADRATNHGIRVVKLRTGIVLSADGGALKKMLLPFKLGIGGPIGNGKHYMPWIHIDDVIGIITAAIQSSDYSGAINVVSPEPVTNKVFSKALGKALKRPAFAPVPPFALKLLYGEMAAILTTGQRAVPAAAERLGYRFKYSELQAALGSVVNT